MKILIKSIPHREQRYDTCGDWIPGSTLDQILVSDLGDEDYNFLVALHELVEFWLCRKHGISDEVVTRFDKAFQGTDPGDSPTAPYHREHTFATSIERSVAEALGVDWAKYNAEFRWLPTKSIPNGERAMDEVLSTHYDDLEVNFWREFQASLEEAWVNDSAGA